jgi:hypothetical protein
MSWCAADILALSLWRARRDMMDNTSWAQGTKARVDASLLAGWDNYYVIMGSCAGGLTGLTFVVIALVQDAQRVRPTGLRVFVTPTIVHFCSVLALAAFLAMPHQHVWTLSAGLAIGGLAGLVYAGFIAAGMPSQASEVYVPVREDWIWHVILPGLVYGCLVAMALVIWHRTTLALYAVAVCSLFLLFIGIHNAWDIAVWMTMNRRETE